MKLGLVAAAIVAGAGWIHAQQAAPPAGGDPMTQALLVEVRGLRAAMEQMASAGPRIQLFTSRLQLQETRINNMIRRLDTVRDSLAEAQENYSRVQAEQKQIDASIEELRRATTPESREELKQAQFMTEQVRRNLAAAKANVDRYAAEETQLTADISGEQARWNDINQRLDELEKLLSSRR